MTGRPSNIIVERVVLSVLYGCVGFPRIATDGQLAAIVTRCGYPIKRQFISRLWNRDNRPVHGSINLTERDTSFLDKLIRAYPDIKRSDLVDGTALQSAFVPKHERKRTTSLPDPSNKDLCRGTAFEAARLFKKSQCEDERGREIVALYEHGSRFRSLLRPADFLIGVDCAKRELIVVELNEGSRSRPSGWKRAVTSNVRSLEPHLNLGGVIELSRVRLGWDVFLHSPTCSPREAPAHRTR